MKTKKDPLHTISSNEGQKHVSKKNSLIIPIMPIIMKNMANVIILLIFLRTFCANLFILN